jgi:hypothetical protein
VDDGMIPMVLFLHSITDGSLKNLHAWTTVPVQDHDDGFLEDSTVVLFNMSTDTLRVTLPNEKVSCDELLSIVLVTIIVRRRKFGR